MEETKTEEVRTFCPIVRALCPADSLGYVDARKFAMWARANPGAVFKLIEALLETMPPYSRRLLVRLLAAEEEVREHFPSGVREWEDENDEVIEDLKLIYAVLGPSVPSSVEDEGARWEWQEALSIAKKYIDR